MSRLVFPRLAGAIILGWVATVAAATPETVPPAVTVTSASRAGSGCPAATTAKAEVSPDRTAVLVEMPPVVAEIAGRGGGTFGRTNCDLIVTLSFPAGWQVTPAKSTVKLGAHLAGGANGDLTYKAYQQGQHDTASAQVPLNPGDTADHDESLKLGQVWSACGQNATIVQSVAVKVRGGDGPSKVAAQAGELALTWRPCQK
jgi:hypothetical protein